MKKILVTGVGGGVGQSILKVLKETPYDVVAVDSEELATGLHAVSKAYKGCYANDSHYIDRLLEICKNEDCGLIFPGHDIELLPISKNIERFTAEGITPVVSNLEVIRISDNKIATQVFMKQHGFPVIDSIPLSKLKRYDGPIVLKPQHAGARSRNTYVIKSAEEFETYRELVDPDNCVVQEYIEGDEYTCGTVILNNKCFGSIVMKRTLRSGDTSKAFVEHPSPLTEIVEAIAVALNPFGACNIQLRLRDGIPYVFEINARCSGTTAARALAGFNEPKIIADYLYNNTMPEYTIKKITILRYWQELVVSNDRIDTLRDTHFLDGDGTTL